MGGGGAFFGRGGPLFAAKTGPLGPLLATENGPRVHFWQQKVDQGPILTRATFSMTWLFDLIHANFATECILTL